MTVSTSVSKYAADYDTVKTAVDGTLRGASIIDRQMGDDDTCKVTMGVFVAGQLSNSIYEHALDQKSSAMRFFERFMSDMLPVAYAQESNNPFEESRQGPWMPQIQDLDERVKKLESSADIGSLAINSARNEPQPTGLIIDVRGHRFLPSMTPELMHPTGDVIYPSVDDKDVIKKSGKLMSLFSRSLEFALNHPVVGDKPLIVKGSVDSGLATRIVLTQVNAQRLSQLASQAFFSDPKIIIVLD